MKTISQYLDQIPDKDVRERAKRNMRPENRYRVLDSMPSAIAHAFDWTDSPEGFNYWYAVYYTPPLTQLQRARREIKRLCRGQRNALRHKHRRSRGKLRAYRDNAVKVPQNALNEYWPRGC